MNDRFDRRLSVLDDSDQHFLGVVAWLGGYITTEQAQGLGIRNSVPAVRVGLKEFEAGGFLKRVFPYPAVYQITKSVTRLLGLDLSARRHHSAETIRNRLLAVNFYLEAANWPVEFVFDHEQKIANFRQLGCEPSLLPQRAGKPYLWEDFVMRRHSGGLDVATRLDTLFLTMPISWRGTQQYVGRLHRLHENKKEVLVYDYADVLVRCWLECTRSGWPGTQPLGMLSPTAHWSEFGTSGFPVLTD